MWEVSNMQKTEQKTEQQAGLGMSFCEEEGRITVFRKTLEALEWPSHYRFLYNRKMKQIAVQACGAEEAGAHRVGKLDESNSGEIKYGIGSHDLRGFWVGQENVLSADRKSFSTAATCFV